MSKEEEEDDIQAIIDGISDNDELEGYDNLNVDDVLAGIHDDDYDYDLININQNTEKERSHCLSKTKLVSNNHHEINPLHLIDKQEKQFSFKLDEKNDLESKFPLKSYKSPISQYNNINYFNHEKINTFIFSSKDSDIGTPKCLCVRKKIFHWLKAVLEISVATFIISMIFYEKYLKLMLYSKSLTSVVVGFVQYFFLDSNYL